MCWKKTFYVDVNAFLPRNLMILKADISKTSTGRCLFLFIFICGNSKCTRIQKIKKISGEVNWVPLALNSISINIIVNQLKHNDETMKDFMTINTNSVSQNVFNWTNGIHVASSADDD